MTDDDLQFHIRLRRGDVGRYVFMPGDPGRVPLIAAHLDSAREVGRNREFLTYTGSVDGVAVSVTSTGIGAPSTAIAAEELIAIGADTLIRVGTAGSIASDLHTGDLVVAQASVRDEGTSRAMFPLSIPPWPTSRLSTRFRSGRIGAGYRHQTGIIRSADSFYGDVAPETMPYANIPWRSGRRPTSWPRRWRRRASSSSHR